MPNIYKIFNILPDADIVSMVEAFKNACLNSPRDTFLYTNYLYILINPTRKLMYDASLFNIDIRTIVNRYDDYIIISEEDEYTLLNFAIWLETYQNAFYDLKYQTSNKKFKQDVEAWYDKISEILNSLKELKFI